MKEADIVKAIMKFLKTLPNCFAWKEHGGMYGTAGIPDIIACIDGKFYGFEVKTDVGKPTKLRRPPFVKLTELEEQQSLFALWMMLSPHLATKITKISKRQRYEDFNHSI